MIYDVHVQFIISAIQFLCIIALHNTKIAIFPLVRTEEKIKVMMMLGFIPCFMTCFDTIYQLHKQLAIPNPLL